MDGLSKVGGRCENSGRVKRKSQNVANWDDAMCKRVCLDPNIKHYEDFPVTLLKGVVHSEIWDVLRYWSTLSKPSYFTWLQDIRIRNQYNALTFSDSANSLAAYSGSSTIKQDSHIIVDNKEDEEFNTIMNFNLSFFTGKDFSDQFNQNFLDQFNTIEADSDMHKSQDDDEIQLLFSLLSLKDNQSPPDDKLCKETTILCVMNTDDTEVPCNHHFFPSSYPAVTPPAFHYSTLEAECPHKFRNPSPSFVNGSQACEESIVSSEKFKRSIHQRLNTPVKLSEKNTEIPYNVEKPDQENNEVRIEVPNTEKADVGIKISSAEKSADAKAPNHQTNPTQHPELDLSLGNLDEFLLEYFNENEIPDFEGVPYISENDRLDFEGIPSIPENEIHEFEGVPYFTDV